MMLLPIVAGEGGWRKLLDRLDTPTQRPGVVLHALLFGVVAPPVGLAAFLLVASWLERDLAGSPPATDMLAALLIFAYLSGVVPALLCGGIIGLVRKRFGRMVGLPLALLLGGMLAWTCFMLSGLYSDGQGAWRAALSGAVGALAAASVVYGVWRRYRDLEPDR